MENSYIYALSFTVLSAVALMLYIRKDKGLSRELIVAAGIGLIIVLVVISTKRRIPLLSNIIDWVKGKAEERRLIELDNRVREFDTLRETGLASFEVLYNKSKELRKSAEKIRKEIKTIDSMVESKKSNMDSDTPSQLPPVKDDPVEEALSLMKVLASRRK